METERALRMAGRQLVAILKDIRETWATQKSAKESRSTAWEDVVSLLDALDDFITGLERAALLDLKVIKGKEGVVTSAPAELASLSELSATYAALELVALWGVTGLVDLGLRSVGVGRDVSRAARLPLPAQKRESAVRDEFVVDKLTRILETFERSLQRDTLSPVTSRFVSDALATALELDRLSPAATSRASRVIATVTPLAAARALRELLGGAVLETGKVVASPAWCVKACSELLTRVARQSVASIMAEFAGDDELRAETGADAPAIELGLANALASVATNDDEGYVRDVAPQLIGELVRDQQSSTARQRIAARALASIARRVPKLVAAAAAGCLETWEMADERMLQTDLNRLRTVAAMTELAGPVVLDAKILPALVLLADFCARSRRSSTLDAACAVLASLARTDSAKFAVLFDEALLVGDMRPVFANGDSGGVELRGCAKRTDAMSDSLAETVGHLARKIAEPAAVGALFARLLQTHLKSANEVDLRARAERLAVLVKMAELLDAGALDASGAAILETLGVVLDAKADEARRILLCEDDDKSDVDRHLLEQVTLGSLLAILELGASERSEPEERMLRKMLPALEALSAPGRPADLASLAADCRVRILTRGAARLRQRQEEPHTWRDALEAARSDLANLVEPSARACGIISLTKYARAATRRREVQAFDDTMLPTPSDWEPIAVALFHALDDNESYVFLAAVHALAALADANPAQLLPFLCQAHETGMLHTSDGQDCPLSEAAIARLGEALVCAVKRRGDALPTYAPKLARALVRGARPDAPDPSPAARCARLSALADLAALSKFAVKPIALDLIELVSMTLDIEERDFQESEPGFSTRRAAAYLARRLIDGSGVHCIEECPRPTAQMCRRLRDIVENQRDDLTTRHHAALALEALDSVLEMKMTGSHLDKELTARDILPLARDDWLSRSAHFCLHSAKEDAHTFLA